MNNSQITRTIFGGAVILVGIGILFSNFSIFDFNNIITTWWPLAIVGLGLYGLLATPRQSTWSIILIGAGVALQFRELGLLEFSVWHLVWPAILVGIGISIMRNGGKTAVAPDKDSTLSAVLSGVSTKSDSKNYQGGKVIAVMGGVELDLRNATIKKEATIEVFTLLGGAEIRVPENWIVRSSAMAILGGIENKTLSNDKKDAPILNVIGTVSLGGVEIRH